MTATLGPSGGDHLQALGLRPERIMETVAFLDSYAATTIAELERASRIGVTDDALHSDERLSSNERLWALRLDAATSLREAAQWSLFLDTARAASLLQRSAFLLDDASAGYSIFLKAISGNPNELRQVLVESSLPLLLAEERTTRPSNRPPEDASVVRPAAQQLAYAFVTATAHRDLLPNRTGDLLFRLAEESPHRVGATPVGSLGTPIRRFWAVAGYLLSGDHDDLDAAMRHLRIMGDHYAEDMEHAHVNTHLWEHAAAPVDVAELDIVGLTVLATRRFGPSRVAELVHVDGDHAPTASIPMQLGLALASTTGRR
jgi:hypothetical protein